MADNPKAFPMASAAAHCGQYGMTLRDWFAGQALSSSWTLQFELAKVNKTSDGFLASAAQGAYEMADAMLAERGGELAKARAGEGSGE